MIIDFVSEQNGQLSYKLAWDSTNGGLKWTYTVKGNAIITDVTVKLSWASLAQYSTIIDDTPFSFVITAGTVVASKSVNIPADFVLNAPVDANFLIIASDHTDAVAISDIEIKFAYGAKPNEVSENLDV